MTNPSQTETPSGSGRNQQQGKDPVAPEPGTTEGETQETDQTKTGTANGGAHPVHVKNR